MKITGSVEIRVIDSRTQKLKQIIKQDNLITNNLLTLILDWVGNFSGRRMRVSISTSTVEPKITDTLLTNIIGTGYIPSGVTSPTYNATVEPNFGQIQNRIDFTGTERTFFSVGLTNLDSANVQNQSGTVYAYLKLDTPCVQGAFDILDLFYRIQFYNTEGMGFSSRAVKNFGANFSNPLHLINDLASYWLMGQLSTSFCNTPSKDLAYEDLLVFDELANFFPLQISSFPNRGWNNGFAVNSHFKFKYIYSRELEQEVGTIFNLMQQGNNALQGYGTAYTFLPFDRSNSPLQNLFSHSANAVTPFFDSLRLASGNGKAYLNGNWTNKSPELHKFTIVAPGATGIASYKWSIRKHLGFNGSNYTDRSVVCPFRNFLTPAAPKMHGWRDENNDVLRYSNTQVVQYDDTGVTLLDIFDGNYQNWGATTLPALPVTQARQVALDSINKRIYIGCRLTGLWLIDVVANSVTQIKNVGCYAVDVGRNAIAYALIDGGLYCSSDWSTPLAFNYAGISDNNWSKVYFLKVDPEHLEDRMALVMQPATAANRRVVWHRTNTSSIPAGTFQFESFGDVNGAAYWIGTNYGASAWSNPHDAGRVTVVLSSAGSGSATNYVDRAEFSQNVHTGNLPNSWVSIDWGIGNTVAPNVYTLKNRNFSTDALRNWKLQGSNNAASNSVADLNAATWTDLDTRVNDTSLTNVDVWARFSATANLGYRWLRILQTGLNSSGQNFLCFAEFEFYGIFDSTTPARIPPARQFSSTYTGVESSNIKPWAASLDVSDIGSFWVAGFFGRLDFGNTTTTSLNTGLTSQQLTHSVWGSDRYFKIAFYKNFLIGQSQIVNETAMVQNVYTSFGDKSFLIHLDGGIALTNRELRSLFTDNTYCWENYGWDGSQWVLDATGAKLTHADAQQLANGLTLRFEDGANVPHFIATDYYTQGVCFGVWKDNASTIYHESAWYSKPVQFDVALPENFTIPAAAPFELRIPESLEQGFVTIEIDSPELNRFKINGQPIATLYTTGTVPPGLNEIRLLADGRMQFNAADANKVVTGSFAYVRD